MECARRVKGGAGARPVPNLGRVNLPLSGTRPVTRPPLQGGTGTQAHREFPSETYTNRPVPIGADGCPYVHASDSVPNVSDDLQVTLYGALASSREAGEGRAGSGYMTAGDLAKLVRSRRVDVLACLEGSPALFRELRREQASALGASARARLFGLAEWPDVPAETLRLYRVLPEHRAAYEAAVARHLS